MQHVFEMRKLADQPPALGAAFEVPLEVGPTARVEQIVDVVMDGRLVRMHISCAGAVREVSRAP